MNTNGRRLFGRVGGLLTGVLLLGMACKTTAMANGVVLTGTASEADVHELASAESPVLANLPGIYVQVLETVDGWTRIQAGNMTGWIQSEYLSDGNDTLAGSAQAQAAAEAAAQAQALAQAQAAAEAAVQAEALAQAQAAAEAAAQAEALAQAQAAAEAAAQAQAIMAQQGVNAEEMELLAALIQCEAGGESYVGQVAVGNVVMNRVASVRHPNTITDVVYARGQFSPVKNGSLKRTLNSGRISESCRRAALEAVAGASPVGDRLYFRRVNGRKGLIIGNHVFY